MFGSTSDTSPMPLYHQVSERIAERILSGALKPGAALPTEFELCDSFGVSRITIRRALDELISRRLVIRRRGVGTFVAEPGSIRWSVTLTGVIEDVLMPTNFKVLREEDDAHPPADALDFADLAQGTRMKVVEGVNYAQDGAPLVYACYYFPPAVAARLSAGALAGQVKAIQVVETALGRRAHHAEQIVEPMIVRGRIAHLLEVKPGTALLRAIRVFVDANGQPIELFDAAYHPQHYRYTATLYPRGQGD